MANTAEEQELQRAAQELETKANEAAQAAGEAAASTGATPEEVKAAVEKARKEEKDKLYPQLEDVRKSLKEVQAALTAEREEKEAAKREAEEKAEKARQNKLSEAEKQNEILTRLEEQLKEEKAERERFREELEARDRKDTIRRYRAGLLKSVPEDSKEFFIEDLVVGGTVEELDRTFTNAKARAEQLAERFKSVAGDRVRGNMPRSTNPDMAALEEQELDESLTQVDQDKYLKDPVYRNKIQTELEQAYHRAAGR